MRSPGICMDTRASILLFTPATPSWRKTSLRRCASDWRNSARPSCMVTCQAYQRGAANDTSATIPSRTYPVARDTAEERMTLVTRRDRIACVAHRAQQRTVELSIDLLAQFADMHVDHVGLRVDVIISYTLQQHGARHHLAGMPHQVFEQLELARLQRDGPIPAGDFAGQGIHVQVADGERRLLVYSLSPAMQRVQAGQQFAECKRLGQIIVAAAAQAADAVIDLR